MTENKLGIGDKKIVGRFLFRALTLKCKEKQDGKDIFMERKWEMAYIVQELQADGWKDVSWYDK